MTQFACGHERIIEVQENEDRPYLCDTGGEQKETVPFTKELRQWQQSFINIGGRALNTFTEIRSLTKYMTGQVLICFENGGFYQFQNITGIDDGENILKPDNVYEENLGRWVLRGKLDATAFNLWPTLKYKTPAEENQTYYVDNLNGADSSTEDGTEANPFKTIQYAIDQYVVAHGYWKGTLKIKLVEDYTDALSVVGLIGNGSLIIQSKDSVVKNVSANEEDTFSYNQIRTSLANLAFDLMAISNCDVSFVNVSTGEGLCTNSKLSIGSDSVFKLNCYYCHTTINDAEITSTIDNCTLIATNLTGGMITATNSIIASNSYDYISVGVNCNTNKPKTFNPLTEISNISLPNITIKSYTSPSDIEITERGIVWATTINPTINDTKIIDSETGQGVYSLSFARIGGDAKNYARAYVLAGGVHYYGNTVIYDSSVE